jgi:hypothetical protein
MKKFAIGCGIVLLVLAVLGVTAGYYVYRTYVRPMAGSIAEMSQMADIEKDVRNTSSFTAPESGELTEAMVKRFVTVQEHLQAKLGGKMDQLKSKYELLDKATKSEKREASFTEAMGALKDLSGILLEAKRAQVEALNQNGFSVKEYEWVRGQVFAAVGIVAAGIDAKNIERLARQAGRSEEQATEALGEVPEVNKTLVAPYEAKLREWAPLAFFGL